MADETRTEAPRVESAPESPNALARFTLLYESRDGRLCLFQDHEGHLTSVDSARFA